MRKSPVTILTLILCSVMLLATLCSGFVAAPSLAVHAVSSGNHMFDSVNVLTDLQSNKDFDINDYKFDANGKLEVINFVEYCYSFRQNLSGNFGLYIYLYNPALTEFNFNSLSNKISMAYKYNDNGEPIDYKKFNLVLCNTAEGDYAGLFYKLRVDFTAEEQAELLERLGNFNQAARRYDISEIELMPVDAASPESCTVAWTITASGFAKGYGADLSADSTLQVKIEGLDTIELDVHHTYYRQYKGDDKYTQLNTVYFAVDELYFQKYGTLQRIKAEWYEYKLKKMLATADQSAYNAFLPYLGQYVENNKNVGKILLYDLIAPSTSVANSDLYRWAYNIFDISFFEDGYYPTYEAREVAKYLYLMFKINSVDDSVSKYELYDAILNYNKSYESGTLPIKHGTISADLFEDDIDADRKIDNQYGKIQKGYSCYEFDYDQDMQQLNAYKPGFWASLFGDKSITEQELNVIHEVKAEHLYGTDKEVSDRLCVAEADVDELKEFYNASAKENKRVVLFRFATSEYFSGKVKIVPQDNYWEVRPFDSYIASETVFLDFDIIQLTFKRDDIYKVIPVAASPIDIVSDLTPPYEAPGIDWWGIIKKILFWAVIVLLGIVLIPVIVTKIFDLIIGFINGGGGKK